MCVGCVTLKLKLKCRHAATMEMKANTTNFREIDNASFILPLAKRRVQVELIWLTDEKFPQVYDRNYQQTNQPTPSPSKVLRWHTENLQAHLAFCNGKSFVANSVLLCYRCANVFFCLFISFFSFSFSFFIVCVCVSAYTTTTTKRASNPSRRRKIWKWRSCCSAIVCHDKAHVF